MAAQRKPQCYLTGHFRLWSYYAEAWDVYLHIRDKRLFCHVGNSRVVFFLIEIRPWFSRKKNKTNNCHSLNSVSGNRLTTVKPHCETSSDGYLTMAMAEDQPLLTVGLRFPMQIKLCGRTYRESCHHKTSSPPNSAVMTKVAGSQPFQVEKKKSYRLSRRSGIWPEPISWGEHT